MKTTKICAQCSTPFEGRSNQLYCSERCKVDAFRAGKTRQTDNTIITKVQSSMDELVTSNLPRLSQNDIRKTVDRSAKNEIKLRQIEFEHERQVLKIKADEAEKDRLHEQTLARIKANEKEQEVKLQQLSKQVDELQSKTVPPLTEWDYYSTGIRRRYGALVSSLLTAIEDPLDSWTCRKWLDEYQPFNREVGEVCKEKSIPVQAKRPFLYLEELAKLIETHRWSAFTIKKKVELPQVLRQQLIQACL